MAQPVPTAGAMDRDFLQIRARLIELAAAFDRIDRAVGAATDPHTSQIRRCLEILAGEEPHRAERVQMVFSLPYDERAPGSS